jgi:hypothetical protein
VGVAYSQLELAQARDCSFSEYAGLGVELQRGGPFFLIGNAEWLGAYGNAETCLPLQPSVLQPDGSVLVEGFPQVLVDGMHGHFRAGAGASLSGRDLAGEVRAMAGITRGQLDFESEWFPTLSASLGVVIAQHAFLHLERRWFRIPQWTYVSTDPDDLHRPITKRPAGSETRYNWQRMGGFSLGWRF